MFIKLFKIINQIFFISENNSKYIELYRDKTSYYKKEINNFTLDKVFIALLYEENLQKDLKNFKYRYTEKSELQFTCYYKRLFEEKLSGINKKNIILSGIPMFFLDRFFRGYNQTYILAQKLSEELDIPFMKLTKKIKYTSKQAILNKEKRLLNLKNCFSFNNKYKNYIKGKTIIIIDDIISTGTTSNEISKVLKKAGVKNVIGLFLATGS